MSPAWADCCSSILGCAATYVTDGLSCEIETVIDTLNALSTGITNFINDINGQTQAAQQSAQQSVSDAYNSMQSQSQQAEADLAAALSQANALYKEETAIKPLAAQSFAEAHGQTAAQAQASGTSAPPRPQVQARASGAPTSSGPPLAMSAVHSQNLAPAAGSGDPTAQKSAVDLGAQSAAKPVMASSPQGTFADAFSRAIQQIQTLKTAGDGDFSNVNGHLQQALNSEGPGVSQANTLAGVMNAPLTAIQSTVSNLLSHPWDAFDPTSLVTSIENQVSADLSGNVAQMIADITTGPNDAFNAAQPTFDDLLAKAQEAQALVAVMTNAHQQRTTAAANALYAALPLRHFEGVDSKGIAGTGMAANNLATKFGQRIPFSAIAAKMSSAQQRAKLAYKAPNTSQLRIALAQFKAQRAQGKTMPPAMLAGYKSKLAQQFDSYFSGKSPTILASQRDQLISQARSQFAKDPTTANAVVNLLNSEAAKRSNGLSASATTPAAALPGQSMATSMQHTSAGGYSQGAANVPVSAVPSSLSATRLSNGPITTTGTSLANPTIPGQPVSTLATPRPGLTAIKAPASAVAPVVQPTVVQPAAQAKTSVWGAAPVQGWTPPAATSAPAPAVNSALKLQAVRSVQQQAQPAQPAPPPNP
jgi:hypothetical protein